MPSRLTSIALLFLTAAVLLIAAAPAQAVAVVDDWGNALVPPTETATGTLSAVATNTPAPSVDQELVADIFIWDTTSQGIGALRAMQLARTTLTPAAGPARLVIASSSPQPTAMPAQGLGVEDIFVYQGDALVSGFWAEFRRGMAADYKARGIDALDDGRLMSESEVASRHLRWYIDKNGAGRTGTTLLCAHLLSARYQPGNHEVLLRTAQGKTVRVRAKLLVDASVEGDLALMLGARYRFGLSETVYGPSTGPAPVPRGDVRETWIQRVSTLVTLQVFQGRAPLVADLRPPVYDPTKYGPEAQLAAKWLNPFGESWTMTHPLPNGKRELNERWSDYPLDIALPHTYIFGYKEDPLIRLRLRNQVLQWTLDKVRYLQEHGFSQIGVATTPGRLYLREGLRVVGRATYTGEDVENGRIREPVAFGRYARYDVHLWIDQGLEGAFVRVPMGSLISADFPELLIPGPISTDHEAYNSAVRMEPLRANTGGAAGIIAAISLARGIAPSQVPYDQVARELKRQGYRLGL